MNEARVITMDLLPVKNLKHEVNKIMNSIEEIFDYPLIMMKRKYLPNEVTAYIAREDLGEEEYHIWCEQSKDFRFIEYVDDDYGYGVEGFIKKYKQEYIDTLEGALRDLELSRLLLELTWDLEDRSESELCILKDKNNIWSPRFDTLFNGHEGYSIKDRTYDNLYYHVFLKLDVEDLKNCKYQYEMYIECRKLIFEALCKADRYEYEIKARAINSHRELKFNDALLAIKWCKIIRDFIAENFNIIIEQKDESEKCTYDDYMYSPCTNDLYGLCEL